MRSQKPEFRRQKIEVCISSSSATFVFTLVPETIVRGAALEYNACATPTLSVASTTSATTFSVVV